MNDYLVQYRDNEVECAMILGGHMRLVCKISLCGMKADGSSRSHIYGYNNFVFLFCKVLFFFYLISANVNASSISIGLTEAPGLTSVGDPYMRGAIVGGDDNDLTPNLCAGKAWDKCSILTWLVERSWPNKQLNGYESYDDGGINSSIWRNCVNSADNKTLGKVIACWRKGGVLQRPLYDSIGRGRIKEGPDLCMFYGKGIAQSTSYPGPISNCLSGYMPIVSCQFGPSLAISVRGTANQIQNMTPSAESFLECTNASSGSLKLTDATGKLYLDGGGVCNLDLGSGVGNPHKLKVEVGKRAKVTAKCSFSGVNTPGIHKGSGIIVFTTN